MYSSRGARRGAPLRGSNDQRALVAARAVPNGALLKFVGCAYSCDARVFRERPHECVLPELLGALCAAIAQSAMGEAMCAKFADFAQVVETAYAAGNGGVNSAACGASHA